MKRLKYIPAPIKRTELGTIALSRKEYEEARARYEDDILTNTLKDWMMEIVDGLDKNYDFLGFYRAIQKNIFAQDTEISVGRDHKLLLRNTRNDVIFTFVKQEKVYSNSEIVEDND